MNQSWAILQLILVVDLVYSWKLCMGVPLIYLTAHRFCSMTPLCTLLVQDSQPEGWKESTRFWPQRRFTNDNEILFLSTHGRQNLWLDGWFDWYYFNNDNNVWCLYQFGSWSQTAHQWIQPSKFRYRSQQYIYSSRFLSIVNFLWVIGLDARIYSF